MLEYAAREAACTDMRAGEYVADEGGALTQEPSLRIAISPSFAKRCVDGSDLPV